MGEYEIGRDFQELRSRIERLEAFREDDRMVSGRLGSGVATRHGGFSGVAANSRPIHWKADKREKLPPFVYSLLDLPLMADVAPETETWPWTPEPIVLFVTWDGGGTDEFYRLQNQSFTKTKWTTPNTGEVNAVAQYNATLVASGKAQDHPNNPNDAALRFNVTLRNAQGGPLWNFDTLFTVRCQDNKQFACGARFDPGLYDLVAGATGFIDSIGNYRIARC